MPFFADGKVRLEGVVARATDDVWAAGTNADANGIPRPLLMHFDGSTWREVSSPASGGSHEWFLQMGGSSTGELWAVGQYFTGSQTSTLTARLSGNRALAVVRNIGANPFSYTTNAPVLGGTLSGSVDLTMTGHSHALLFGFETPATLPLGGGQTLLVNVLDPAGELFALTPRSGPLASFSTPVPADAALCGFVLSSQAIHFGGSSPFALSNAQDMTVGN